MQKVFVCTTLLLLSFSSKAQERIDSIPEFVHFLSSIPKDEVVLIILSDGRCGKCLLAENVNYLEKLNSIFLYPIGMVDSGSDFGKVISMKHRINKLPAILVLDNSGQLLRRIYELPIEVEEMRELQLPFDTLPRGKSPLTFDLDYPKFFEQSFHRSAQSQPYDEVLSLFFQSNPKLQDEMVWAVALRFHLKDEMINQIILERDTLIGLFGKEEVYDKLDKFFFDQMKASVRSGVESQFESMIAKAELAFGQDEFEYTFKYKSYFYQLTGNWNAYLKLGNEINANGLLPQQTLTEMAQILLNYSNEEGILGEASGWFSEELTDSNLENADLKVILLWRGGEKTEAKELALKIKALPNYSEVKFPYSNSIMTGQK
ncbi:hypothetical protein O3Q51_01115 [Cryomorphaceae bacterium 1068]|nr:hypothetical protein [Cryomorphaceae bacterium 1068]